MLTPAERARIAVDPHPERFLAGRMLLRELAAELTGRDPASTTVTAACPDCGLEHGGPRVDGLFVSLSHAGEFVVAAASATGPVGVDAERRDGGADRVAALHDVAGGDSLEHWTRVEAVLKADGRGLRVDPREVGIRTDVAILTGTRYRLIDASDDTFVISVAAAL
jgi:4'-phosphopantetheinyl transferase